VCRHRFKHASLDKQLEDLKKAEYYLKRLIDKAQDRVYSGRIAN